jgi:hypothetical protein
MRVMPRSAWTTTPRPVRKLVDMRSPVGLALHWPGPKASDPPIGDPGLSAVARILEAERRFHIEVRGWSDIAYGAAVDQAGRVWDCRGLRYRSAANGNQTVNASHGAVTCLLGPREQPSPAMVDAVRQLRRTLWLPIYPRALAVVGHRDLHSTDCPGPALYAMIRSGTFTDQEETDMQLSDRVPLGAGTRAVLERITGQPADTMELADLLQRILGQVLSIGLRPPVDVDALAEALLAHLPPGSDAQAVARAVAADLAARLQS